jgi:hypothetical protein
MAESSFKDELVHVGALPVALVRDAEHRGVLPDQEHPDHLAVVKAIGPIKKQRAALDSSFNILYELP